MSTFFSWTFIRTDWRRSKKCSQTVWTVWRSFEWCFLCFWHKLNERNVFQKCSRTQYLTKFIKLWRSPTKTDSERCQMRKFYIWNFHWESIWFLKFIFKDLILYSLSNSPPPVLWISNLLENTHDLMVHKISLKLEASSAVRITLWENPWGRLFMWSDVRNTLQLLQLAITILIFYVVSPRAA